jgi:hypothetical protein
MEGYHDDLLFALGIALWVLEQNFKNLERLEKKNKAMLDGWSMGHKENVELHEKFNKNKNYTNVDVETLRRNKKILQRSGVQDPNGEYLWLFK